MGSRLDTDRETDVSGRLLAAARSARQVEEQAARDTFIATARYAAAHTTDRLVDAAALDSDRICTLAGPDHEYAIPLTGEGAPMIAEAAVIELTTALGYTPQAGRQYLADVLEVRWRLPRLWARIQSGTLQVYRARAVARVTHALCEEAAAWVDQQVAAHAHKIGWTRLERIAREAAALFEPDMAAAAAEETVDDRRCDIHTDAGLFTTSTTGAEQGNAAAATARLEATLDTADALDLEQAVSTIAHALLDDDATADRPLHARRATALGVLARAYNSGAMPEAPGTGRVVQLVIHTDTRELAGTGLVRVANTRGLATIEQLHRWATLPGTTVKPITVLDLTEEITTDSYTPTTAQRRQTTWLHETCAFPGCTCPAERTDLDHRIPHDSGGRTTTSNLTPLCRRHHRAKTLMGWTYARIGPARYLWRSPHGYLYLTGPDGTIDLTDELQRSMPARSRAA